MVAIHTLVAAVSWAALTAAHTVITYPGWRGNNLHANGTLPEFNPDTIGIDTLQNDSHAFPFGMQWMYPCKRRQRCETTEDRPR